MGKGSRARASVLALASGFLVGCGSGSTEPQAFDYERFDQAQIDFAACMRAEGLDVADPETAEHGLQLTDELKASPLFDAAFGRCKPILAKGGPGPPNLADQTELVDQALQYARCLREQGLDVADPEVSREDGGSIIVGPEGMDPEDPRFIRAQDACSDVSIDPGSALDPSR